MAVEAEAVKRGHGGFVEGGELVKLGEEDDAAIAANERTHHDDDDHITVVI